MAGRRACRHDMRCPHFGSNRMPKDERSRGKRTYRCGDCKYRCAPTAAATATRPKVIDRALAMYAEGASVAAIGGAMEINEATASSGLKKALSSIRIMDAERSERKPAGSGLPASVSKIRGINADAPQVKTVSFDEMWTYLGVRRGKKRRSAWIWTAVVEERDGSRRSDCEVGRRDAAVSSAASTAAEGGEIQERPL